MPGGPQRIMEGKRLHLIAELRKELVRRIWSWPTTSSTNRGRMRSDKGSEGLKSGDIEGGEEEGLGRFWGRKFCGVCARGCLEEWEEKNLLSLSCD